jgi:hypothetical protein
MVLIYQPPYADFVAMAMAAAAAKNIYTCMAQNYLLKSENRKKERDRVHATDLKDRSTSMEEL